MCIVMSWFFGIKQTSYYTSVVPHCEGLEIKYVIMVCLVGLWCLNVLTNLSYTLYTPGTPFYRVMIKLIDLNSSMSINIWYAEKVDLSRLQKISSRILFLISFFKLIKRFNFNETWEQRNMILFHLTKQLLLFDYLHII